MSNLIYEFKVNSSSLIKYFSLPAALPRPNGATGMAGAIGATGAIPTGTTGATGTCTTGVIGATGTGTTNGKNPANK